MTPEGMIRLVLTPVEVFGADDCDHPGCTDPKCPGAGFGLMDAVGPGYSDCNRAEGKIYRVEDLDPPDRFLQDEGSQVRVEVWVAAADLPFFAVRHGEVRS